MTELELQVQRLGEQLREVTERVRLDAVAEAFLQGTHTVRMGDYFLLSEDFPVSKDRKGKSNTGHEEAAE